MQSRNPTSGCIKSLLFFLCAIEILSANQVFAHNEKEQEQSGGGVSIRKASGSYCGLYCLYTVLRLAGQNIDFTDLIKKEYIGSREGSSLAELKRALEDHGLYALAAGRLTSAVLRQSDYPIILHVKGEVGSGKYDHYELFLGTRDDKPRLFNPPDPARTGTFCELAPRWDGNGLIISTEPIDLGSVLGPVRRRLLIYVAAAIGAILGLHLVKRWLPRAMFDCRRKLCCLHLTQGVALAAAALVCGLSYHFGNDGGLLTSSNAIAAIQETHRGTFVPKIGEKKVHKLLDGGTVFIDARFTGDYKVGHLDGAINLPVDSNDIELHKATAEISKDADIVLYCQSSRCKFAEIVALKLIEEGYSNISIFRGGWIEWVAKNGKPRKAEI